MHFDCFLVNFSTSSSISFVGDPFLKYHTRQVLFWLLMSQFFHNFIINELCGRPFSEVSYKSRQVLSRVLPRDKIMWFNKGCGLDMDKDMDSVEETRDIVIVGGGICGLATALALHRKGLRSIILEKSETLRDTGSAIVIRANGWRALDQLGVASELRQRANPIQRVREVWIDIGKQQEIPEIGECRCVKRNDLIEILAEALPPRAVRFGSQIVSVKVDKENSFPILQLYGDESIQAKGTVTVAGDAMHVTGPFLGQGGSAALEDAVVLARCLAQKVRAEDLSIYGKQVLINKAGEGIDLYVKERRKRLVALSTRTYLTGLLLETRSKLVKFFVIMLLVVLFSDPVGHTKYDCGRL
ncbi:monooxygenase 1-like [Olea europaea subsp. europaea]|uniref:Monooxygenase 1-like n=2 Tax=Olea europaea subsp. europaea TaxID=158383 RepID=A0A8S0VGP1_OLEEU|nr:monooxygenase 1-like [Olea europaea subsp. europaea]